MGTNAFTRSKIAPRKDDYSNPLNASRHNPYKIYETTDTKEKCPVCSSEKNILNYFNFATNHSCSEEIRKYNYEKELERIKLKELTLRLSKINIYEKKIPEYSLKSVTLLKPVILIINDSIKYFLNSSKDDFWNKIMPWAESYRRKIIKNNPLNAVKFLDYKDNNDYSSIVTNPLFSTIPNNTLIGLYGSSHTHEEKLYALIEKIKCEENYLLRKKTFNWNDPLIEKYIKSVLFSSIIVGISSVYSNENRNSKFFKNRINSILKDFSKDKISVREPSYYMHIKQDTSINIKNNPIKYYFNSILFSWKNYESFVNNNNDKLYQYVINDLSEEYNHIYNDRSIQLMSKINIPESLINLINISLSSLTLLLSNNRIESINNHIEMIMSIFSLVMKSINPLVELRHILALIIMCPNVIPFELLNEYLNFYKNIYENNNEIINTHFQIDDFNNKELSLQLPSWTCSYLLLRHEINENNIAYYDWRNKYNKFLKEKLLNSYLNSFNGFSDTNNTSNIIKIFPQNIFTQEDKKNRYKIEEEYSLIIQMISKLNIYFNVNNNIDEINSNRTYTYKYFISIYEIIMYLLLTRLSSIEDAYSVLHEMQEFLTEFNKMNIQNSSFFVKSFLNILAKINSDVITSWQVSEYSNEELEQISHKISEGKTNLYNLYSYNYIKIGDMVIY